MRTARVELTTLWKLRVRVAGITHATTASSPLEVTFFRSRKSGALISQLSKSLIYIGVTAVESWPWR